MGSYLSIGQDPCHPQDSRHPQTTGPLSTNSGFLSSVPDKIRPYILTVLSVLHFSGDGTIVLSLIAVNGDVARGTRLGWHTQ